MATDELNRSQAERTDLELEDLLTDSSRFFADPYPTYRRLQDEYPMYWSEALKTWLVTRYADVKQALMDNRLSGRRTSAFIDEHLPREWQEVVDPMRQQLTTFIGFVDPPDHTRLRGLVNTAFTSRVVEGMRPRIQEIVDGLLDQAIQEAQDQQEFDIVRSVAFPLPAIVIAELLGVPSQDRDMFKAWADEYVPFITAGRLTLEVAEVAQHGLSSLREYVLPIIEERRRQPQYDLMSSMIAARSEGSRLSDEELVSMCITMLIGGHETTTNLIANGMLALLRHRVERQALIDDPGVIEAAVEELLRYDAPVQRTFRIATEDFEFAGAMIRKGSIVSMMLGAANRDPSVWTNPDLLDIRRPQARHLAFGHGSHFCVGAPLARLEAQIAISTMLRRMSKMTLTGGSFEYQSTFGLRALRSLPVEVRM